MNTASPRKLLRAFPLLLAAMLLPAHPVLAEKPSWKQEGKEHHENKKKNRQEHHEARHDRDHDRDRDDRHERGDRHFDNHHHEVIRSYFGDEFRSGNCPPGLAKKNNGCYPPGQVRKWKKGHPLPPDVHYYDLPPDVLVRLGPPPSGYRYVRVAGDILLIAVGTSMIMDAIMDLGR